MCLSGIVHTLVEVGMNRPLDSLVIRLWLSAIITLVITSAVRADTTSPADAEWCLGVAMVSTNDSVLHLRLWTMLGAVQKAEQRETGARFTVMGGALLNNVVEVGLFATNRTRDCLFLRLGVDGERVSGTCTGVWDKALVTGSVTGTVARGTSMMSGEPAPCVEMLAATCFGTGGNDDFEGAVAGPDGCLYLVGNVGQPISALPDAVSASRFGKPVDNALRGCGFVLKLSPEGSNVLAYAELAPGVFHATAVAVTDKGVYVGGYASDAAETLLVERKGLIREYPLRTEQELIRQEKMTEANGVAAGRPDPIADRPWLGRLGAPCVLKFSTDLKTLESGTYLEGWQQVYDKTRICGRQTGRFREFFWQPINICPLGNGDVAVAHDGGYFRRLTEADREMVAKVEPAGDRAKLLERLSFYDVADYVSRLSGDLTKRSWKTDIRTPPTDPEVVHRLKTGWNLPHFGNPRTHRMRADNAGNLWVCGWSATLTSQEPWWSPFLWCLDPESGRPTKRLYEHDPMSGGGNRMGGQVADTAVLSVSVDGSSNLLACLIADGGNSVMEWGPLGAERKRMTGPVVGPGLGGSPAHFWGQVHRIDGKTFDGLGGAKSGPWAWPIDAAGAPDGKFIAVGRWNAPLPWTPDAWWINGGVANPNAFIRVVGPDCQTLFWTALPGVRPFEITPIGGARYIVVGLASGGKAPVKNSLMKESPGGEDAFFAILQWK